MIDYERDRLVPVTQLVEDRTGRPISPMTLWRWRTKGIKTGDQRTKLECVRVRGTWHTTTAAFAEFIRAQTEAAAPRAQKT